MNMNIEERLRAFTLLGKKLRNLSGKKREALHHRAGAQNPWFTPSNIDTAIEGLITMLDTEDLRKWMARYGVKDQNKTIGLVMAGNIPFVGFHDLLCVLMSGNRALVKLSSKDNALMAYVIEQLKSINPGFKKMIVVTERLQNFDAIIATGSDNSSRYFEHYFSRYPHIIRKNRTSAAIINGSESSEDFRELAQDIFLYFGLGCRNVSKLFVPVGYDFRYFFESIEGWNPIAIHHKYTNNYDYNKSIYLVNREKHLDNGFLLLKESRHLVSPIAVIFYEHYNSEEALRQTLHENENKVQCIVAKKGWWPASFEFGKAQQPKVWDYADQVDTMKFLIGL